MADENGKKTGGRVAGVPNKKTQHILELAQEFDADPALFLIHCMKGNSKELGLPSYTDDHTGEEVYPDISFDDRKDAAAELMPYLYGKRKPVDSQGDDSTDIFAMLLSAVDANK